MRFTVLASISTAAMCILASILVTGCSGKKPDVTVSGLVTRTGYHDDGRLQVHLYSSGNTISVNFGPRASVTPPSRGEIATVGGWYWKGNRNIIIGDSISSEVPEASIASSRVPSLEPAYLEDCCTSIESIRRNPDESLLVRLVGDTASYLGLVPAKLVKYVGNVKYLNPRGVLTDNGILIVETLVEGTDAYPPDFVQPYRPSGGFRKGIPFTVGDDGYLYDSMGRVPGYKPRR